ncbi:Glutaminase [Gloeothece citriformis PCC 7424]|uniref:Glutaminase n=1 Tax=Gloeothece citriformis (strain PCC 7424) TaxID=65393 RepID=B7KD97_GLOC7|nr:glutaminase [Gloeothece citriformis]ACK68917.1 Glutaminase [Gloeothece citriformis PCC 7424]
MNKLETLQPQHLLEWVKLAQQKASFGKTPDYIPLLHQTDPQLFSASILTLNHQTYSLGNSELTFPLMSVIKPFLLFYVLSHLGTETVFKRVGNQPSDYPFNALEQLIADGGFPRNPMINSGAITLASLLPGKDGIECGESLRLWLNQWGNCQLFLDRLMLESVQSLPNPRNQALLQELSAKGSLKNPQLALNTYNYICCLAGNTIDLARLGLLLINPPSPLQKDHCQIVQNLMITCGLYESSREFAQRVGLPTKSGVSGAVLSIVPEQGAIACYSPPLDQRGNSLAGLFLVEEIAKAIFCSLG